MQDNVFWRNYKNSHVDNRARRENLTQNRYKPNNHLSNAYCNFDIGFYYDDSVASSGLDRLIGLIRLELEFRHGYDSSFILLKKGLFDVYGVYFMDWPFAPDMIKGRSFSEDDFSSGAFVAIVSEGYTEKCEEIEGEYYLVHDGVRYRVIGTYRKAPNIANQDADAFYSLAAGMDDDPLFMEEMLIGDYQLDSGESTQEVLEAIGTQLRLRITYVHDKNDIYARLASAIDAQEGNLFSISLVITMVFLNTIGMVMNWVQGRRRELRVRYLVGASHGTNMKRLFIDFLFMYSAGFLIVCLFFSIFVLLIGSRVLSVLPYVIVLSYCIIIAISIAAFIAIAISYKQIREGSQSK